MDKAKRDAVYKDSDKLVLVDVKMPSQDDSFYSARVRLDAIKSRSYLSSLKN